MHKVLLLLFFTILYLATYCQTNTVYIVSVPAYVVSKDPTANEVVVDSNRLFAERDTFISALPGVELLSYFCMLCTNGAVFRWSDCGTESKSQMLRGMAAISAGKGSLYIVVEYIRFKGNVRKVDWTYKVRFG